jgi:hypothetical protein
MNEWAFLLTPLVVLPIVLLFRFVGCGFDGKATGESPSLPKRVVPYRDYIMGIVHPNTEPVKHPDVVPRRENVIAYWRLLDTDQSPTAKDENGFQDAFYKTHAPLPAEDPAPAGPTPIGSEAASGKIVTGQPGVLVSEPTSSRFLDGGYVIAPFKTGLYTDEFTIEAWIFWKSRFTPERIGYERTLFRAGGHYTLPGRVTPSLNLFEVVISEKNAWQVRVAGTEVFVNPPSLVPLDAPTHVAVTVAKSVGTKRTLRLFVDAKERANAVLDILTLPLTAPLFIGVSPKSSDPGFDIDNPPALHRPLLCRVQEVVLHNKALSTDELENHVDINKPFIPKT